MGTRFIATKEAPVHQNVKEAIVAATELDTRLVMRPLSNIEEVAGVYPQIMREADIEAGA